MLTPDLVRAHFPALAGTGVYLDNPGGTQVARAVLDRMQHYLIHTNANHGGAFATSVASDAATAATRALTAEFLGAARPEEIIFGANMTTLTMHLSRSLARSLMPGDELIVTRLDHDANIAPWLLIAQEHRCTVRWVDITPDGRLDLASLERLLSTQTRLIAVGYASNALGTVNDVQRVAALAHQAGALCFVDAVHYAPHGPIDVQALDCDFLACSAYKFFGPHLGILYGKYTHLAELTAYKVRPSGAYPPDKFETGTGNYEAIAGLHGALDYLQWVGTTFGTPFAAEYPTLSPSARTLRQGMRAIQAHERTFLAPLLDGLRAIPGVTVHGITNPDLYAQRIATVSFTLAGHTPRAIGEALARENLFVWDGNFYALAVSEALGLEATGGMVRVGPVHYNTLAEIERFVAAVARLAQ